MVVITKEHLDKFDKKYFTESHKTYEKGGTEIKWRHPNYVIKPWKNVDRTENYRQFSYQYLGGKQRAAKNMEV